MKTADTIAMLSLSLSLAVSACRLSAPPQVDPQLPTAAMPAPGLETAPAEGPATAAGPVATSASSVLAQPRLEVVQTQAWTDRDGQVRVNVLLRNPYDYPVQLRFGARANLLNEAGEFMRGESLYSLDGIAGGTGFILPGETIAANGCFTCENTPLPAAWSSVEAVSLSDFKDATGLWNTSTDVEASIGNVAFNGDSPIFDVSGTVKNNGDSLLDRVSVRLFLYDQAGDLVGAAEASAWDVGPGATVSFDGYGIGEAPEGPFEYEVTVLGVSY